MQKVSPVGRYKAPRYPSAEQAAMDPTLLKHLPKRFAAKPAVFAALGAVLSLGLAGCQAIPVSPTPSSEGNGDPAYSGIIPVFTHGDGMGSYGCVSVAPPVFLSEEEAASVIREEAAKYGLSFDEEKCLENAQIPRHNTSSLQEDHTDSLKTGKGELVLDGYDTELGIGFEFVSIADLKNWPDPKQEMFSSVESYYFKDAAEALAENNPNVVAFYDPASADFSEFNYEWPEEDDSGAGYTAYAAKYEAQQKESSIEELRAQVRDFLEWLKGQGVI